MCRVVRLPLVFGLFGVLRCGAQVTPGVAASSASPSDPRSEAITSQMPAGLNSSLELRGIVITPDGPQFSIHEVTKNSARWVKLNQRGQEYTVRAYRVANGDDYVDVEYHGTAQTLVLKHPKVLAATQPAGAALGTGAAAIDDSHAIPVAELLPAEEAQLELLIRQVQQRIATQRLPAGSELLPDEASRFKMLFSQVRVRRTQTRPVESRVPPSATP